MRVVATLDMSRIQFTHRYAFARCFPSRRECVEIRLLRLFTSPVLLALLLRHNHQVDLEISHILNASMKASSHTSMDHLLGAGGGPSASPGPRPNPEAAQMRMAAIQGAASMAEGTMPLKGERPVDMLPTPQQQQHAAKGNENSGESVSTRGDL